MSQSTLAFSLILHVVNMKLFIELNHKSLTFVFLAALSIVFYYLSLAILSTYTIAKLIDFEMVGIFDTIFL